MARKSVALKTIETKSGVANIPIMFDKVALKTAADTFPCEIAVNATEDEIVEGKAHKKKKPSRISGLKIPSLNEYAA
ncbi:MAG: hypothetical protein FD128_1946 [Hyphomonadaceae bacterium]|nr:MAG: hypothetical protein FD128_1946 [Hyphomonadaceae bacterium]